MTERKPYSFKTHQLYGKEISDKTLKFCYSKRDSSEGRCYFLFVPQHFIFYGDLGEAVFVQHGAKTAVEMLGWVKGAHKNTQYFYEKLSSDIKKYQDVFDLDFLRAEFLDDLKFSFEEDEELQQKLLAKFDNHLIENEFEFYDFYTAHVQDYYEHHIQVFRFNQTLLNCQEALACFFNSYTTEELLREV